MTGRDLGADLNLAHALADAADGVTLERFAATDLVVETKPDLTPVSDADRAVEDLIRATLANERPADGVIGEERPDRGAGRYTWVIDPIDGTKNFVRALPVWATLIALLDGDEPVLGVVSAPALGRRWWAVRGEGAYASEPHRPTPRRLQVSGVRDLGAASLSFSSLSGWTERGLEAAFLDLTRQCWRLRGYGDFWSYMLVAEGAVEIAAEPELNLYDMAALVPIVTEAGGSFTGLDGRLGPYSGNALATNGLLHERVLAALTTPANAATAGAIY